MPIEEGNAPDPGRDIASHPALGTLSASVLSAVGASLQSVELASGESLFPEGDRIDALYIVCDGVLRAIETGANGGEVLVRTIVAGEVFDQLQVLSGGTRAVQVRAHGKCLLWMIPGDVVDSLAESHIGFRDVRERIHRRQLFCRLHPIFGALDKAFLDDLEASLTWRHLRRGDLLFEQNDIADHLHFVVSGRVQTIHIAPDGTHRRLGEASRGDAVGETEFFTGEPRSARVQAVRDSVLVDLATADFDALVGRRPHVLRHVTRNIVERQRRPVAVSRAASRVSTIAVLGVSPRVSTAEFTTRLTSQLSVFGATARFTADSVNALMAEPGIAHVTGESAASERLLAWLEGQEARHRFLVYETDPGDTEWTQRCLRLADRILIVANAADDPRPSDLERALLLPEGRITDAHQLLILVQRDGAELLSGTPRWLAERPHVEEHHHVRWSEDGDFGRIARVLVACRP